MGYLTTSEGWLPEPLLTQATVKRPHGFLPAGAPAGQAGEGAHCYLPCCSLSNFSSEHKPLRNSQDDGTLEKRCL